MLYTCVHVYMLYSSVQDGILHVQIYMCIHVIQFSSRWHTTCSNLHVYTCYTVQFKMAYYMFMSTCVYMLYSSIQDGILHVQIYMCIHVIQFSSRWHTTCSNLHVYTCYTVQFKMAYYMFMSTCVYMLYSSIQDGILHVQIYMCIHVIQFSSRWHTTCSNLHVYTCYTVQFKMAYYMFMSTCVYMLYSSIQDGILHVQIYMCIHVIQFSSRWHTTCSNLHAQKSPYVLHPVSQKFPQHCL